MSTDLTLMGDSPFDVIRRDSESGECWSARELMPLLGYTKWERFEDSIERARISAASAGHDVDAAISRFREMVPQGGAARVDYKLSRFGCYLVAMNGDVRKREIAEAQTYFAVKTREAETRTTVRELSRRELADYWARAEAELEVAQAKVAELAPAAHSWEQLAEASGDYSLREAAQILDRDPSIRTGQNRLAKTLKNHGWTDRNGRPYQQHVNAGRLVVRSRSYDHPVTGEPQATTQLRVTVKGLADLHQLLGGTGPLLREVAS